MSEPERDAIKALFIEVHDKPAARREAILQERTQNMELRDAVRVLCDGDTPDEFLVFPDRHLNKLISDESDPLLGQQLGAFQLIRRIGAGAMGMVYEAEQHHPHRRVAVKILRTGDLANPKKAQRFLHESEALARLQHPSIVQVYASGTMTTQWCDVPWFAMELLTGMPLNVWAEKHGDAAVAIEIMLCVLDAVHHAHQNGVVHRDLKPSNVIVTGDPLDETAATLPHVKVVDFGVARLDPEIAGESASTMHGDVIGSVDYMSPEQLEGNSRLADARTDVYACGVMAYELLTGQLPYRSAGQTWSERIEARQTTDPVPVSRCLRMANADIDAVLARALEYDPDRRYASASDFADDLRRYLNREPVRARRQTPLRRFSKYLRRNRTAALGVAATILALLAGIGMYAGEAARTRAEAARSAYEAEKATAINNFLTNDFMPKLIRLSQSAGSGMEAREVLIDRAIGNAPAQFGSRPAILAAVHNEAGTLYYNCGLMAKAVAQYEQALRLWADSLGESHPDALKAQANLGLAHFRNGQLELAEENLTHALNGRREVLGDLHLETCQVMNNLAQVLQAADRFDEAEPLLREAVRHTETTDLRSYLTFRGNLARLLKAADKPNDEFRLQSGDYFRCLEIYGDNHPFTQDIGFSVAQELYRSHEFGKAIEILESVYRELVRIRGAGHPTAVSSVRLWARCLKANDKTDTARAVLTKALDAVRKLEPEHDNSVALLNRELERLSE